MKRIACIVLFISVCLLLCACGTDMEAPDSIIRDTVNDYIKSERLSGISDGDIKITANHKSDSSNHTDTVKITAELEYPYGTYTVTSTQTYQYSQSNDTWSLYRRGSWSEPEYAFNSKLAKNWHIDNGDDTYDIDIKSVNSKTIKLECEASETVYGGLLVGNKKCMLSASGTYTLDGQRLSVKLNLPDGFYVSWYQTSSGENETFTYLNIMLSLEKGIESALISPEISVQ